MQVGVPCLCASELLNSPKGRWFHLRVTASLLHLCSQFCPFPAHSSCEVSLSHGSIPPPSIPCAFYSKPWPLLEPPDCLFALLPPPWPCPLSHRQTDTRSGPFQSEITLCHYLASTLQGDHSGLLAAFIPAKRVPDSGLALALPSACDILPQLLVWPTPSL